MPPKRNDSPQAVAARQQPIASGVRAARAWSGMNAEQLADAIHTSTDTVYSWEAGRRRPPAALRARVAEACGVPIWLVEGHLAGLSKPPVRGNQ